MFFEETLRELGLTKNEAKIYFALLKFGKSNVSGIAHNIKIHRANTYDAIISLINKGLISHVEVGDKKEYAAKDPEVLRLLIKQKEAKLNELILQLGAISKVENTAQIFEGIAGIKRIMEDTLIVKKSIYTFGIPEFASKLLLNYVDNYHKRRISEKIYIKHIYNENAKERITYLNSLPYTEAKYLPPEYNVPVTTTVYENKVAFWIWSDVPFSLLVESEKMAMSYQKYFSLLWNLAK